MVRETKAHVALESSLHAASVHPVSPRDVFWRTTLTDRHLSTISQAGLVNNLNDGMAWGLFPLFFAAAGLSFDRIGILAAIYPGTWGVVQLATGALSDRIGRKWLIATGMWVQAAGITLVIIAMPSYSDPSWIVALHRFLEVCIGIVVGMGVLALWPSRSNTRQSATPAPAALTSSGMK